ncbi:MAG: Lon protease family protein [Sandaracinaceae bacterium]
MKSTSAPGRGIADEEAPLSEHAPPAALEAAHVRRHADPASLPFETTSELEPLEHMLGQERAAEALRFGMATARKGYNVFVLGPPGLGKHGLVHRLVEQSAEARPAPTDWVYVSRFDDPDRPRALALPPGRGRALSRAMDRLTEEIGPSILAALETPEFRTRKKTIEGSVQARSDEALNKLAKVAEGESLRLARTKDGLSVAPVVDGAVLGPAAFNGLPAALQSELRAKMERMEGRLTAMMQEAPRWQRAARDAMHALEREMAGYAAAHQLEEVRRAFEDLDEVTAWLDAVEQDIVEHAAAIAHEPERGTEQAIERALTRGTVTPLGRYRVNVVVDRTGMEHAPVVYEDRPTLPRLAGHIEQRAHLGALVSDFTLIRGGALHEANGGTLIVDARRLTASPGAYEALGRALRRGVLTVEAEGRAMGYRTGSLEPDPIPLSVKVILIGDRGLFYRLRALDPEFDLLFKVMADFADDVPWDDDNALLYARLIASIARDEALLPFASSAVARMLEHGARLADDSRRLTTELAEIADVLREADWQARDRKQRKVEREDVSRALDARHHREGRISEKVLERFEDGSVRVLTEGSVVGQVNGLSVMALGRSKVGQPNRITATVRLGRGEVVDIERESELGGPLHVKGVLILSSFLGSRYTPESALSIRASLVFEQSYGGVDGDSASMAELCCLLSALSGVPIDQRLAITGSVDQRGQAQAIGGVNEKIEGFFDVCRLRGGDGPNGVLIPTANVPQLMLRDDVVEAVRSGSFQIYPMDDVDDALIRLTGEHPGVEDEAGAFAEASLHGKARIKLARFAELARAARLPE